MRRPGIVAPFSCFSGLVSRGLRKKAARQRNRTPSPFSLRNFLCLFPMYHHTQPKTQLVSALTDWFTEFQAQEAQVFSLRRRQWPWCQPSGRFQILWFHRHRVQSSIFHPQLPFPMPHFPPSPIPTLRYPRLHHLGCGTSTLA